MLQAATLEVRLKLPVDMVGQGFALLGQLVHQGRVVRFDELVETCLLGLMPPPVARLREYGVPIALATDCNPGTSPLCSIRTAMVLGSRLFGLTPEECLAGVTREAAAALGLAGNAARSNPASAPTSPSGTSAIPENLPTGWD